MLQAYYARIYYQNIVKTIIFRQKVIKTQMKQPFPDAGRDKLDEFCENQQTLQ